MKKMITRFEINWEIKNKERAEILLTYFKQFKGEEFGMMYPIVIQLEKLVKHYTKREARYVEGMIQGYEMFIKFPEKEIEV